MKYWQDRTRNRERLKNRNNPEIYLETCPGKIGLPIE
jgi:hypothetical protein